MDEEYLMEFCKQYQKKYNHVTELHRLTKELGDTLSRDDRVSACMILDMRQEEMTGMEACERNIGILLESLDAGEREKVESCLKEGAAPDPGEPGYGLLLKIQEIQGKTKKILRDTVEQDKILNQRIAGKDSYYSHE